MIQEKTPMQLRLDALVASLVGRVSPRLRRKLLAVTVVWVEGQECIRLPLTRGMFAIIDEQDALKVLSRSWFACRDQAGTHWYARTHDRVLVDGAATYPSIFLHHMISGTTSLVDHKNRNTLDDRRCNLRAATHVQNCWNSSKKPNTTSRFKGVCWDKKMQKWKAYINKEPVNGKKRTRHLGYWDSESSAASAFNLAAKEKYGEFAVLNIVPEMTCHSDEKRGLID